MKAHASHADSCGSLRRAFTLLELLVTMALALLVLAGVIELFAWMSGNLNRARSALEMHDRLRAAAALLQKDLQGVTVTMLPPRDPGANEGYFEYLEGPMGADPTSKTAAAHDTLHLDNAPTAPPDSTVGDVDDVLMFTTRSVERQFSGQNLIVDADGVRAATVQSPVAEVAWFVRGHTLYRRQLLVLPELPVPPRLPASKDGYRPDCPGGIYYQRDISMRLLPDPSAGENAVRVLANSLGDLTKRENRYAHPHDAFHPETLWFPYDVRCWGPFVMPNACESTSLYYWPGCPPPVDGRVITSASWWMQWRSGSRDFWAPEPPDDTLNPYREHPVQGDGKATTEDAGPPYKEDWIFAHTHPECFRRWKPEQYETLVHYPRAADDVVLSNVIGFDVKAWDPGAPVYEYPVPATASAPAQRMAIAPEDPGYSVIAALRFAQSSDVTTVAYGAFVDLGYLPDGAASTGNPKFVLANPPDAPQPHFNNLFGWDRADPLGRQKAEALWKCRMEDQNPSALPIGRVYDTWSTHYDRDPILRARVWNAYRKQLRPGERLPAALPDPHNGFDDGGAKPSGPIAGNGPDHQHEALFQPPYPYPLRSIRVRLRTFEPVSRQIREITVEQDFLPR